MTGTDDASSSPAAPGPVGADLEPGLRERLLKSATPFRVAAVTIYLAIAAFALYLLLSDSAAPGVPVLIIVAAAVAMRAALAYDRRRSRGNAAR